MPKVQAFLSLEKSAASTMTAVWSKSARGVMDKLYPLLESGRWDDAHDIASRLTLNGVVEAHRPRLEELAVSSLLFGAHHVAGQVKETSFVKGTQELPYALQQALDQLTDIVETAGADLVRKEVHAMIRRHELHLEPEEVAKAELRKAADLDLAEQLNAAVLGTGKMMIDIGANLTTSRLVSLGFLAEAIDQKVDTYQIDEVLDSRICPVCEYMHGKTFSVTHEYQRVVTALGTMDTKELKSIAPWPSQSKDGLRVLGEMSLNELQTNGYGSPPFHPGCRGILAMTGTVTEVIPLGKVTTLLARKPGKTTSASSAGSAGTALALDVVTESQLRQQIAQIKDGALQQEALTAYVGGDTERVRLILVEAGIISGDNS